MKATVLALVAVLSLALSACGGSQYIMSTTTGNLLISQGRPSLDEEKGVYMYKDAEGKKATVNKADIVQILER
ncbi:YgdI/YgdR family lipoprotein [Niveibacterium sp. SC-1]|uniref:YgdI/YgdR family lipoprotein n=1 Tax=Niveibacterium sp. SC-1 TaxID=3135646 RepID=UPI00311F9150